MASPNILFVTTCILLFWSVNAGFLRNLAEKAEKEPAKIEVYQPALSHKLSDYDTNDDDLLDYEEFVFTLIEKFKIKNPEDVREDFFAADKNGDGKLNREEFADFPLYDSAEDEGKETRAYRKHCKVTCILLILCGWTCH